MKVVAVDWADAFIDPDDFTIEEGAETKPVYRTTVGFFIATNEYGICLATDYYEDNELEVAGKLFIPKGMIIRIREFTEE